MRPSSIALPSFKVTIGSGSASFLRFELVGIHGEAHGASRLAPVESRLHEDFVESFLFGLEFHQSRSRDDHGVHAIGHFASNGDGGDLAKVLNAAVRAAPDEYLFDRHSLDGRAALETNVIQRTGDGRLTRLVVSLLVDLGNVARDGNGILGGCSPGYGGCNVLGVDDDRGIVRGALVRPERSPIRNGLLPILPIGTHGTSLEVIESDLVGSNDSGACTGLDGHVGNGHAGLHGEFFDGLSGEFDGGAGAAGGADDSADVEDDVFGGDARFEGAVDADEHVSGLGLGKGLSRQNMFHLTSPNPKRQSPKRPMRRRMRITTNRDTSRQRKPLLRANNMHNPLPFILHTKVPQSKVLNIRVHLQDLGPTGSLLNKRRHVQ
mmetsp:Transcript_20544/g.37685  ORF Transcript_20544/g.37685 Transcript_20544/m.37685 type:complete len:378 (+) Transcript_20544:1084-2217(+)